jgi:hypothetical protein
MSIFDRILAYVVDEKQSNPGAWALQIADAEKSPLEPMKKPGPSVTADNPFLVGNPSPGFDKHSATWKWMVQWSNEMIDIYRKQNDNVAMDERSTAYIRGHIDMCKKILALEAEEKKPIIGREHSLPSPIHY